MATDPPNLTLDDYLQRGVEIISQQPIGENPNVFYGTVLSPDELKVAAMKGIGALRNKAIEEKGADFVNQLFADFEKKVVPKLQTYDRVPFEYDDDTYFPGYADQVKDFYENIDQHRAWREMQYVRGNYPESVQEPRPPFKPFGYDKSKEIAKYGWNPFNELDFPGVSAFRHSLARGAPPNLIYSDLNYAKENMSGGKYAASLPGNFIPINLFKPQLGSMYIEEGKEDQIFDSPTVRPLDIAEFVQQEGPTLTGEIAFGLKGLKHFDAFLRKSDIKVLEKNPLARKFFDSVAGNVFLAGGAAGTRFLQRLFGAANGAHNRPIGDMLEEAGWIMLLAYGGNQTIDIFLNGLPKLYRAVMGKDLGAEQVANIRAAIERKRASKGKPKEVDSEGNVIKEEQKGEAVTTLAGRGHVEEVTLFDIDEAIEGLTNDIGEQLIYKPTLARASKDEVIADIENMLIQGTNNPAYRKFYDEAMKNNEEVIQKFFGRLFDKLDPNVTGSTISKDLLNLMGRKKHEFVGQTEESIENLILQVDNIKQAGTEKELLEKILDKDLATKLYPKLTQRINQISRASKNEINETVDKAILDSGISDLEFTSRTIRKQLKDWRTVAEGKTGTYSTAGKSLIRKVWKDTFGDDAALARLMKYTKGELNLPDLNRLRIDITSVRAGIDPSKGVGEQKLFQLTKDLQKSIENQIYKSIRKSLPKKEFPGEAQKLIDLFDAQRMVYDRANKEVVKQMAMQQPEGAINYLLSTGSRGRPLINTKATEFMTFLKETGSVKEIRNIQNTLINHIKRNFLDTSADTPLVLAKNYKQFIEENESTLRAIFGEELFTRGFPKTGKAFNQNIIEPIEKLNRKWNLLEQKYGQSNPFNIVSRILDSSPTAKMEGSLIDDLDFLDDLLSMATPAERKILKSQFKDASKKYLYTRMQTDGLFDPRKLNRLFNEGFGPADVLGQDLSFKGVYRRLLGEETDSFFRNLEIVRDIAMREYSNLGSGVQQAVRAQIKEDIVDTGTEYARRFFIPPLTQFGRRMTALDQLIGERNLRFIGKVLQDEKLFNAYIGAITGRKTMNNLIRVLKTYEITYLSDIANTLEYYDKEEKRVKPEGEDLDKLHLETLVSPTTAKTIGSIFQ